MVQIGFSRPHCSDGMIFPVHLVECGPMNIKITYPEDLIIAEAILAAREKKEDGA